MEGTQKSRMICVGHVPKHSDPKPEPRYWLPDLWGIPEGEQSRGSEAP